MICHKEEFDGNDEFSQILLLFYRISLGMFGAVHVGSLAYI